MSKVASPLETLQLAITELYGPVLLQSGQLDAKTSGLLEQLEAGLSSAVQRGSTGHHAPRRAHPHNHHPHRHRPHRHHSNPARLAPTLTLTLTLALALALALPPTRVQRGGRGP